MKKYILMAALLTGILLSGCSKTEPVGAAKTDQANPIKIVVWHYYNGTQKSAFDKLISEFNSTRGKEIGIFVESHNKGNVMELEKAVMASITKEVGSEHMPNIFSSYADTAYEIEKTGELADISPYFMEEELDEYVDSYIEEGRIGAEGELKIFPTAKSTEVLMVNKTIWDEFSTETGANIEALDTLEGMAETAELYYNWTDGKTPDIANDGKAFYGRDAMANLFYIGSMQMGIELFQMENQTVKLNVDREVMKRIWDTHYIPYIKGYYGAYGRFRSDDVKVGELVAYTGSIASASYFPDNVEIDDDSLSIECMVKPAPVFAGSKPYIIQQGAGMLISKGTREEEEASCAFLKWFTEAENNLKFGYTSCYLPVKKKANSKALLDKVIKEEKLALSQKEYDTLITAFDMVNQNEMYTGYAFEGSVKARKILEYHLSDKAAEDRKQVKLLLEEGMSLEEAVEGYSSAEAFDAWYQAFSAELQGCIE